MNPPHASSRSGRTLVSRRERGRIRLPIVGALTRVVRRMLPQLDAIGRGPSETPEAEETAMHSPCL
jgi:hypothetical protein